MPTYKCYSCMKSFSSPYRFIEVRDGGSCPRCHTLITELNLIGVAPQRARRSSAPPRIGRPGREETLFQRCLEALQSGRSVCIGERHEINGLARRTLINYLPRLAHYARWIGLEIPEMEQDAWDQMGVEECRDYFNQVFRGKEPGLGDVMAAARNANLGVLCYDYMLLGAMKGKGFDDKVAKKLVRLHVPPAKDGLTKRTDAVAWENANRTNMMNRYAADRINVLRGTHALAEPYLILVGAAHIDPECCRAFPTLQDLLIDNPLAIDTTK